MVLSNLVHASLIEGYLFETLLGIIVTYNIGVHIFFWQYIKDVEKSISKNKDMSQKNRSLIRELRNHWFGIDEDETNGGAWSETENEFEKLHEKIDESQEIRKREHEEVRQSLIILIHTLSEKDSIEDIKYSDFDL